MAANTVRVQECVHLGRWHRRGRKHRRRETKNDPAAYDERRAGFPGRDFSEPVEDCGAVDHGCRYQPLHAENSPPLNGFRCPDYIPLRWDHLNRKREQGTALAANSWPTLRVGKTQGFHQSEPVLLSRNIDQVEIESAAAF